MDFLTFIVIFTLLHCAVYFTDQFLKSCLNVPYLMFLENVGLTIRPFQLNWFTTAFNRAITKWAVWRPRFFRAWFTVGAIVVCILLLPSVLLLISGLIRYLRPTQERAEIILEPVVPGLNLPMKELPYYFVTLLVSSVVHEAGHALAAVKEDVHVNGFGFILMFVLPGAFVDVPTEEIRSLTPFRQLKILCAGVWHNIILGAMAYAVGLAMPFLLKPLYVSGQGVMVMSLTKDSPARGPVGLQVGDIITEMNKCTIEDFSTWENCIVKIITSNQIGFCIPESVVHSHDETIHHAFEGADGSVQCCNGDSSAHLCFELLEDKESDVGVSAMQPFSCLPARLAISMSTTTCLSSTICPKETHCFAPSLHNSSKLVQINRQGLDLKKKDDVIYLGPPVYLYRTVSITNYIPKYSFLPYDFPESVMVFCDYIVKFSLALAVLNMIPVVYLDGYRIFGAIIDMFLSPQFDRLTCRVIHIIMTVIGTALLIFNVILGIHSIL